jgi:uncharacterized protein
MTGEIPPFEQGPPPEGGEPAVPAQPSPEGGDPFAAPRPERVPFWGYSDLFLIAGLAVPCMIAGAAAVKLVMLIFHWHAAAPAGEAVPAMSIGYGLLFGALMAIFRVQYGRPFWRSLGWTPARVPFLWNLILGFATAFAVGLTGRLLRVPPTSGPIVEMMKGPSALVLVAIFGTTVAPLCEELAFRGFLQPLLVRSLGAAGGILLASTLFGLLHYWEYGASWINSLQIGLAGAAFGCVRHWTGSTRAAVIMHAAFNGLSFVGMFAQGGRFPH